MLGTTMWGTEELRAVEQYIRGQLTRWIDDADDLDDVTQECLKKAWGSLAGFRGESKPSTWLYRIAHNEAISFRRRRARRRAVHEEWGERITAAPRADLADRVTDAVHVKKIMNALPEMDRRIVEMAFVSGMTSAEIGSSLEMAASSVRCRINRIRGRLREATPTAGIAPVAKRAALMVTEGPARIVPELLARSFSVLAVA